MARYKKKVKDLVKYKLSVPEYISLYKANTAKWAYEQTKVFYDEQTKTLHKPHYFQIVLMNGTYSSKLTVVLKCRQCLTGDSPIKTVSGYKPIQYLYEKSLKGLKLPDILSVDKKNNLIEDKIIDIWSVGKKKVYKITLENNLYIQCTSEHKINTSRGYVELKNLKLSDYVVTPFDFKKYSKIKKIEYIGEKECYDLTTKYYHNYISNGISTHNSGFSTAITAMCAHDVLFNLTKGILFVSISKVHSEELMDKFYKAIDSIIDPRFRLTYVRKTLTECEFTNGIKVRSLSSNPDTMIGFTGTVVWDEAGRFDIQTSREVWTCLFPSITTPGNRMYVISTPFGKHNIFHNLCTSSNEIFSSVEKSNISRKFIKVHWRDVPHVAQQINILRENCVTENAFKMGYCCEFGEETVDSLFPYEFMRDYAYPKDHKIIPFDIRNILKTDPMGNFLNNESVMYS